MSGFDGDESGTSTGGSDGVVRSIVVVGQEIRRSSANAVAVDVLYVFTTAFFATLAVRGTWPALIAGLPLVVMLAFAWMSSRLFLLTNLIGVGLAVVLTRLGYIPL
ncbi:hypothetical protein [Halovivax gelatinilyticus]|uniref:hypothetical protein n=1 Tax=Halovivax gelatinilyticus TaxID=2961597 RepID=UPI0020CA59AC|nr:hypothetical protein [Halovivax gelatinilyticus]